ncbi:hypothetical protein ACFYOT_20380 [Saccharothrix saharensis]|uniref:hypothetical protein n=1 Tax=Saccharothrix saharensis TaxID=571190 RepID=UPI003695C0B4
MTSTSDGGAEVVVWDTRTGAITTRVGGLSPQQARGRVGFDGSGATLLLTWSDDFDTVTTDARDLAGARHLSTWALPTGEVRDDVPYDRSWPGLVPLGDLATGPVAVFGTSTVGLVLPSADRTPWRRLTGERPVVRGPGTGEIMDRLCAVPADPNTDEAVRELVPPNAYQGDVCPS